jgi:hypothetical protein
MKTQIQIQAQLNAAASIDLDILEMYKGKEIIADTRTSTYGGILTDFGHDFVRLEKCKLYNNIISDIELDPSRRLERFRPCANRILARSSIEHIISVGDILSN